MPRKNPRLVFLLNVGLRAIERWLESRPDRPAALTSAQVGTIFYLFRNDGALIGEVAQSLMIGAPAMSGMANRMEQAGLIMRHRDTADGRSIRLFLTKEGKVVGERARSDLARLNAALTEGFSEAEMAIVERWLASIPGRLVILPRVGGHP